VFSSPCMFVLSGGDSSGYGLCVLSILTIYTHVWRLRAFVHVCISATIVRRPALRQSVRLSVRLRATPQTQPTRLTIPVLDSTPVICCIKSCISPYIIISVPIHRFTRKPIHIDPHFVGRAIHQPPPFRLSARPVVFV